MREDNTTTLLWFVAGLGLGTAIGLMMAPQAGVDTRRMIGKKAGEAGGFVATNSREYFDRGKDLYERGRHLAEEASEMFNEGRRLMAQADAVEASEASA